MINDLSARRDRNHVTESNGPHKNNHNEVSFVYKQADSQRLRTGSREATQVSFYAVCVNLQIPSSHLCLSGGGGGGGGEDVTS